MLVGQSSAVPPVPVFSPCTCSLYRNAHWICGFASLMVINSGSMMAYAGPLVKKATYEHDYHELTQKDGAPFVPYAAGKIYFADLSSWRLPPCAAYFGPYGPSGQPDPTIIQTAPRPDYFFFVVVRGAFVPASVDGDTGAAHRPGHRARRVASSSHFCPRGRKKLAPAPDCCSHDLACRVALATFHSSRGYTPWSRR